MKWLCSLSPSLASTRVLSYLRSACPCQQNCRTSTGFRPALPTVHCESCILPTASCMCSSAGRDPLLHSIRARPAASLKRGWAERSTVPVGWMLQTRHMDQDWTCTQWDRPADAQGGLLLAPCGSCTCGTLTGARRTRVSRWNAPLECTKTQCTRAQCRDHMLQHVAISGGLATTRVVPAGPPLRPILFRTRVYVLSPKRNRGSQRACRRITFSGSLSQLHAL